MDETNVCGKVLTHNALPEVSLCDIYNIKVFTGKS